VVKRKAIFFDRDGIITVPVVRGGRAFAAKNFSEFEIYPDAAEAVSRAREAKFLCIIVTNQPDVASGQTTREFVESVHSYLMKTLELDDIEVSFDPSGSDAPRRKPNPGMLIDAAKKWGIDLQHSFVIGDTWRDVDAARAAGCRAIYVNRNYEHEAQPEPQRVAFEAHCVLDAVLWCVTQEEQSDASY
jgi:D-glycero-D-manno-heptose 1,7-bisphosphate phosphatase